MNNYLCAFLNERSNFLAGPLVIEVDVKAVPEERYLRLGKGLVAVAAAARQL